MTDVLIRIRKDGTSRYPWQVYCPWCDVIKLHFTEHGAVVVNSNGVGNRVWSRALVAALLHHNYHKEEEQWLKTQPLPYAVE